MREPRPIWLLIALVAVAVVLPTAISVPVVALVLLVVGGSRWWIGRTVRGIGARCDVPEWAHFDAEIEAVVEIRNGSRLPAPWVELDLPVGLGLGRAEPYREALTLPPGGSAVRSVPLRCVERGRHHVGPPRVRVGDVLGVADAERERDGPAHVTVFPRIVPLERLGLPAVSPFVTIPSRRSLLVDPSAIVGVRDYRAGDPLTSIHWTATARTRRLMVKQYERAEARETLVCLDLCPDGFPRTEVRPSVELAVTVAASVLHHAIVDQRLPGGLLAASWSRTSASPLVHLPPRDDRAHLRLMLEYLALAQARAPLPLGEVLSGLRQVPTGTTVLVVTGRLDPEVTANLIRLVRDGIPVAVALTGPSAAEDTWTIGDVWLPVYRVSDVPSIGGLAA